MAGRAPISEEDTGPIDRCFLFNRSNYWDVASNPLNKHSTIRKGLGMQKMGPGYGFAKALLAKDEDLSIGLVVNAKGGSKIDQWGKGSKFYNEAIRRTKWAQKGGTLKGILWHQGESDFKAPDGYSEKLFDLRVSFGQAELPFLAGEIHKEGAINSEINSIKGGEPMLGVVSSEGLNTKDGLHFDGSSVKLLGERYAEQRLKMLSALPRKLDYG